MQITNFSAALLKEFGKGKWKATTDLTGLEGPKRNYLRLKNLTKSNHSLFIPAFLYPYYKVCQSYLCTKVAPLKHSYLSKITLSFKWIWYFRKIIGFAHFLCSYVSARLRDKDETKCFWNYSLQYWILLLAAAARIYCSARTNNNYNYWNSQLLLRWFTHAELWAFTLSYSTSCW